MTFVTRKTVSINIRCLD